MNDTNSTQERIDEGLRTFIKRRRLEINCLENCVPFSDFAIRCAVSADICPRPFERMAASAAPSDIVCAFDNFKNFVLRTDSFKSETIELLWPVFLNSFLDLLASKDTVLSKNFCQTNSQLFSDSDLYRPALHALKLINSTEDISRLSSLNLSRNNRFTVSLSADSWKYVERFLKSCSYIREIFHRNIDVKITLEGELAKPRETHKIQEIKTESNGIQSNEPETPQPDTNNLDSPVKPSIRELVTKTLDEEPPSDDLTEAIAALRGQLTLPNLVVLDIDGSELPATVSAVASSDDAVVIGLDNGVILLNSRLPDLDEDLPKNSSNPLRQDRRFSGLSETRRPRVSLGSLGPFVPRIQTHPLVSLGSPRSPADSKQPGTNPIETGDPSQIPEDLGNDPRFPTERDPCIVQLPKRLHDLRAAAAYSEEESVEVLRSRTRLLGHRDSVTGLAQVQSAGLVLSSSSDCTVRAWSLKTGRNIAKYEGHQYPIWDLAVSPREIYFATASQDMTARLWTTCRTFPLRIYAGHMSHVDRLAFHPNCNYLATASSDSCLRMFAVQSGNMVRLFPETHTGSISSLAFSPNGNYLAAAGEEQVVKIWDLRTSREVCRLEGHSDSISSMVYSKDGNFLLSGDYQGRVRLWNVKDTVNAKYTTTFDLGVPGSGSVVRRFESHVRDNIVTAVRVRT